MSEPRVARHGPAQRGVLTGELGWEATARGAELPEPRGELGCPTRWVTETQKVARVRGATPRGPWMDGGSPVEVALCTSSAVMCTTPWRRGLAPFGGDLAPFRAGGFLRLQCPPQGRKHFTGVTRFGFW